MPLGYRPLPPLNIACSGQSVTGRKEEWPALANGNSRLLEGMDKLYDLFRQAPHLGSLIDPRREAGDLFTAGFSELRPLLEKALAKEKVKQDADATAVGVAAQGITKAAELLSTEYTLVATNVPFLTRSKQADILKDYCEKQHPRAKNELATAFVERCTAFTKLAGTAAFVSPQSWLFLAAYTWLRADLLENYVFNFVVKLGPAAFDDMNWWAATTMLGIVTHSLPDGSSSMAFTDVSPPRNVIQKAALLLSQDVQSYRQSSQLRNPDHRIG
ncbi:MAG TPA: N-6 DNA methylase, partial [Candidatus Binatia bacterium]|nr:N-6 DNA methylase [Candidatus Binatia bacterium]